MIRRSQYRCSFKDDAKGADFEKVLDVCKEEVTALIKAGKLCNVSFYRYENMGFLYMEEIVSEEKEEGVGAENLMHALAPFLKTWPREEGDVCFAPMIKAFYQYNPEEDLDKWEHERTTAVKTRVGRVAFAFPEKVTSYVKYHKALTDEGLLKGDKYAYISLHENLFFSYFEEPRNNVNISGADKESEVLKEWLKADPESHFDRVKAKGINFLVIPCLFTVDRVDL
ncbi:MAG: hypothetical protein K6G60_07685 [Lachnospiraceae bacterium]|nr:hypothetical protein [Lachnospiraceae bacterium]